VAGCGRAYDVGRESEGHSLGAFKRKALVEETIEVHVHTLAGSLIQQDVLAMPIAQAHNVSHL
jgi:hypothetical protein